jgi:hypothetical protein
MKFGSGEQISNAMNGLEEFILQNVLGWRAAFSTPYDFIELYIQEIENKTNLDSIKKMMIITKATQICELIFLCKISHINL